MVLEDSAFKELVQSVWKLSEVEVCSRKKEADRIKTRNVPNFFEPEY